MAQILRFISIFFWLAVAGAQYGEYSSSTTTSLPSSSASSSSSSSSSTPTVQTIDVGEDGRIFDPDTLVVSPGSQVQFNFYPGNHSVVQGAFADPCQPLNETSFFSGFVSDQSTTFTLTINDTNPIWYYCGQVSHCQAGMVGVINPPSNGSDTLAVFKSSAANVTGSTVPASVQGGVLGESSSGTSTSSSSGTSGTPASSSTSHTGEARVLFPWTDASIVLLLSVLVSLMM